MSRLVPLCITNSFLWWPCKCTDRCNKSMLIHACRPHPKPPDTTNCLYSEKFTRHDKKKPDSINVYIQKIANLHFWADNLLYLVAKGACTSLYCPSTSSKSLPIIQHSLSQCVAPNRTVVQWPGHTWSYPARRNTQCPGRQRRSSPSLGNNCLLARPINDPQHLFWPLDLKFCGLRSQ